MARAKDRDDRDSVGLIADEPVRLEDEDAFGHSDYVNAIASILMDAPTPFTVGVFGPWGSGKSSVIEGLRRKVAGDAVLVVFDAWRHEGHALRRQFLNVVARQLHDANALRRFRPDHDLRDLDADVATTVGRLRFGFSRVLRAIVTMAIVAVGVLLLARWVSNADLTTAAKETPWGLITAILAAATLVATLVAQIVYETQETTSKKRLDEPDRFTERFEQILLGVDRRFHRIVIAVDNLDRCSPDHALEMLGTIKTYVEPAVAGLRGHGEPPRRHGPGRRHEAVDVVFLVAVDDAALRRHLVAREVRDSALDRAGTERVIASDEANTRPADAATALPYVEAVWREHEAARDDVDEYLRKFFSLHVRLRDPVEEAAADYVETFVRPVVCAWLKRAGAEDADRGAVTAVEMATVVLGRNPRRIKQFVNTFEARMRLIRARHASSRNADDTREIRLSGDEVLLICELALVEEEWPRLYEALLRDPRRLARWHRWSAVGAETQELAYDAAVEADRNGMARADAEQELRVTGRPEWPRVARFLRVAPNPADLDVWPLLISGKVGFTGVDIVVKRLRDGQEDTAVVNGVLRSAEAHERARHLEAVHDEIQRLVDRGYDGSAATLVRGALSLPTIQADPSEVSRLLQAALQPSGRLRSQLFAGGPTTLLTSLELEDDTVADAVVRIAVDGIGASTDLPVRTLWLDALAGVVARLPASARRRLEDAITDSVVREGRCRYGRVLETDPTLLADRVIEPFVALTAPDAAAPETTDPDGSRLPANEALEVLALLARAGRLTRVWRDPGGSVRCL